MKEITNLEVAVDNFLEGYKIKLMDFFRYCKDEVKQMKGLKILEKREMRKKIVNEIGLATYDLITGSNMEMLDEEADKICKDKKKKLIARIEKKLKGEVTGTHLYIGCNGELNGTIETEKNTLNINSIIAGGYNIQKAHFRVLIK